MHLLLTIKTRVRHSAIAPLAILFAFGGTSAEAQTPELLLFGGANHETFLGCLNCTRVDSGSVCNKLGEHGSRFGTESIWNRFGTFGSRFSSFSPWNRFATDPPVVVDREGNFYGYFTVNRYHANRTRIKFFLLFLDSAYEVADDLERARDLFCAE